MEAFIINFGGFVFGAILVFFVKKHSFMWLIGVCMMGGMMAYIIGLLFVVHFSLGLLAIAILVTWSMTTMHHQKNKKFTS